jgi:hypothetical protein
MMKFNYKNKQYQVEEPTVEMWSKLTLLQEWTDEREFCIKLLSFITGLTEEDIENSDYMEVNGKKYRFLDLPNLTFGEFIDIDTYLTKEPHEKKKDMPLLMAMLYRELDENGNYKPYNSKELQVKAEEFKKLPIKYVRGATNFFFHLEKTLSGNFQASFWEKLRLTGKMIWILVKFVPLISFGVGSLLLFRWRTKILQRLKRLLNIR